MEPWNRWLHCIGGTYGSWLPGDPRGFRTRHHREHVEGDYRDPPLPGLHANRHARARALMRQDPIIIPPAHRPLVCRALANCLLAYEVELIDLAVGGQHFHLLCRFPDELPPHPNGGARRPRNQLADGRAPIPTHILGRAKRAASVALARAGHKPPGRPLWARRCKFEPIRSRSHQLATVRYIRRHAREGAAVRSML